MRITYITYQTFPASSANSQQSIGMIKNFVREGYKLNLIFPERSNKSSDSLINLQKFYGFKESFEIQMLKHNLPFKDYNKKTYFKKFRYIFSHFIWSYNAVKYAIKTESPETIYFTRSDWVYFFLALRNRRVILECHQVSKIRKFVIKYTKNKNNVMLIFTHKLLKNDFKLNKNFEKNTIVLENGFDEDFFDIKTSQKNQNTETAVFVGNLLRFNQERGASFLIDAFNDSRLRKYNLVIVGGPEHEKNRLQKIIQDKNIKNIEITGKLSRLDSISKILNSKVGILINSSENRHSTYHTSPLKYYEYLRSNLNIVGTDFPSHRNLSFGDDIFFYKENDMESFITSIKSAFDTELKTNSDLDNLSINTRAKKIIEFIARPEGVEPPTF